MAFTVREFRDLIRVLDTHPEWREELRRQVLTEELLSLPQIVRDLAARVESLTARVESMAEFQQRHYEEFTAFRTEMMGFRAETERSFQKLAEAQTVTQAGLDRLGGVIGDMQRTLGSTVEEEAQGVLIDTLEKKGYHLIEEAYNLSLDGEVDVVQAVRDQDGRPLWALAEVKVRLGPGAVEAWANRSKSEGFRLQLSEAGIPGPYLVYVFGLRVERRAFEAAETFGIGLLRGRGEAVMPKGEIAGVK